MQIALGKTGYVQICGILRSGPNVKACKNGQTRCDAGIVIDIRRGDDGKPVRDQDGRAQGIWANITAWGAWAEYLATAEPGDAVKAIGTLQSWERDGRQYKGLSINNAGFIDLVRLSALSDGGTAPAPNHQDFQELDDDGELPF